MRRKRIVAAAASVETDRYVLVVDDTEAIREALIELLREEGIAAVGAVDGSEALVHLRSGASLPFAVLTDLMMPVLDGWELIEHLQADATLRPIRVVAMTASPLAAAPEGVPLLRKPFRDFTELLNLLGCR